MHQALRRSFGVAALSRAGVAALFAAALLCALTAFAQVKVAPPTSRVTDLASVLTPEQRNALEQRLTAFEAKKGSQIAVLIVPTTEPETIEQFAFRVAEQWKVGRKRVDDGALLVVAVKDRALRIEVGYGLEGALPDAVAKRIVSDDIIPHFKRNDYHGGIDAGITRMMAVVEGEALPPPADAGRGGAVGGAPGGIEGLLIVGFMLVFVVGGVLRAMFGKFLGSGVIGTLAGVAGWLTLGSIAIGVGVALVAMFLSLMGGLGGGRRGRGWSSGWPGGGFGGGWGGGGGGSWGGGGGGFGGGGASGRW
jgi:uncharacterized protein